MKAQNLLSGLLLLACTVVNLAVLVHLQDTRATWPAAASIAGLGIVLGQAAVVIAWIVWGAWNLLLRLTSGMVLLFGLSWVAGLSVSGSAVDVGKWYGALLVYFALLALPLTMSRLTKYHLSNRVMLVPPVTDSSSLASWQFSIWSLLCAMTATGAIIALLRFIDFPWRDLVAVVLFFLILTITACLVLFAAFFGSRIWPAFLVTVTICPLAGYLLSLTTLPPSGQWLEMICLSVAHGLTILTLVAVLRAAGYRLSTPTE